MFQFRTYCRKRKQKSPVKIRVLFTGSIVYSIQYLLSRFTRQNAAVFFQNTLKGGYFCRLYCIQYTFKYFVTIRPHIQQHFRM